MSNTDKIIATLEKNTASGLDCTSGITATSSGKGKQPADQQTPKTVQQGEPKQAKPSGSSDSSPSVSDQSQSQHLEVELSY